MRTQTLMTLTAACVLLYSTEARLNQTHYEQVPLEWVVQHSQHIVIARPENPFMTREQMPIKTSKKGVPPFTRVQFHYTVLSELKGRRDWVGRSIAVDGNDWRGQLSLHTRYYVEGVSKSPIEPEYDSSLKPGEKPREVILFLRVTADGPQLAVGNAMESIKQQDRITALIKP